MREEWRGGVKASSVTKPKHGGASAFVNQCDTCVCVRVCVHCSKTRNESECGREVRRSERIRE